MNSTTKQQQGQDRTIAAWRRRIAALPVKTRFLWWTILQIPGLILFWLASDLVVDLEFGQFTGEETGSDVSAPLVALTLLAWTAVVVASAMLLWEWADPRAERSQALAALFGLAAVMSHAVIIPPLDGSIIFAVGLALFLVGLVRGQPLRWATVSYLLFPGLLWGFVLLAGMN